MSGCPAAAARVAGVLRLHLVRTQPHECEDGVDRRRRHVHHASEFRHRGDEGIDLERPAAFRDPAASRSCAHRRPRRRQFAGRRRWENARRVSPRSPGASSIIARATARGPGVPQITSRVAPVSALIGLKLRFPHSFIQISSRICFFTGALNPASRRAADKASTRGVFSPEGSPMGKAIAFDVRNRARFRYLARRVDHAADRALRPDRLPLHAARIDAVDAPPLVLAAEGRGNTTTARR